MRLHITYLLYTNTWYIISYCHKHRRNDFSVWI